MDRPFDTIRDTFKKTNEQNKDLLKFVFEKSDAISLWLIGLSIGAISIFANNIANVKSIIPSGYLKPILILLAISITCGIIYRSLYLYFYVLLTHTMRGLEVAFSKDPMMDTESVLTGDDPIETIFGAIKTGFDEDHSSLIPLYYDKSEIEQKKMRDDFTTHYLNLVAFAQKDVDLGLEFVADTYSKFFGSNKEKMISKMKKESSARSFLVVKWITTFFFISYMLAFIVAMFLFIAAI